MHGMLSGQARAKATGFRCKADSHAATNSGSDGAVDELRFVEVWAVAD